ncbi:hypothetical protein IV203_008158 [Nitzschia inconspicua]|uniref:Uncharacterized protein n=1 Tax=Nitzschia inconspicua TaxID=303405 RepID=A0A9K3KZV3_9STRA|nr:hypothetical protein IV203_008158 [Nitzschia inconspicua]
MSKEGIPGEQSTRRHAAIRAAHVSDKKYLFRGDRALLVDDNAVPSSSGVNHLSTALVDYLLQRSLQPSDLQDTTLVGSANSIHFFDQVNAKIAFAPSDPNVAKSVENIWQGCSHYKDNKFEFLSPFCIDHHFVAVKIVFDLRSPDIFHEVSVYDPLIKGGRRNNSVHHNSPPAKYLSNSLPTFVCLRTPSSENDCHDDGFLQLLEDLPNYGNDIDVAPDDPNKALLPKLDHVPLDPRLGADPQPEPTRHRDNYFTSQSIKYPRNLKTCPKLTWQSRLYFCRAHKKRVRDKLEESVDHVIEVKDGTPVSKNVMKAAANVQGVRASYNQAYRAIGPAGGKAPREEQQASFGLLTLYLHHFQLRNEDSSVKAESDSDQRLWRLGI